MIHTYIISSSSCCSRQKRQWLTQKSPATDKAVANTEGTLQSRRQLSVIAAVIPSRACRGAYCQIVSYCKSLYRAYDIGLSTFSQFTARRARVLINTLYNRKHACTHVKRYKKVPIYAYQNLVCRPTVSRHPLCKRKRRTGVIGLLSCVYLFIRLSVTKSSVVATPKVTTSEQMNSKWPHRNMISQLSTTPPTPSIEIKQEFYFYDPKLPTY